MTERTQLILYFSIATFVIVVFIAVLLIRRTAAKPGLAEPGSLEAFRCQNDAEHGDMRSVLRDVREKVDNILERLGFLKK